MAVITIILLGIGTVLILLEIVTPGGISFCVGLSTILVAIGYQCGYITSFSDLLAAWAILSLSITSIGIIILRSIFAGKVVKDTFDEDSDAFNHEVKVRKNFINGQGAIFYLGTVWKARCNLSPSPDIRKGDTVRIVNRDNITWIVEPFFICKDDETKS